MKLITPPKSVRRDDPLGFGIETGLAVIVFFGLGAVLDSWLGTSPVFMIVLVAVAGVAVFVKLKYTYDAQMKELDAERLEARRRGHAAVGEGPAS